MKDTKYALAVIIVISAPFMTSLAFKSGFWACEYQVMLSAITYILIGALFGWIWPKDIRKLGTWMVIPIAVMSLLSLMGGFALGVDMCWLYTIIAWLVSPVIGLILGKKLGSGRGGSDSVSQ